MADDSDPFENNGESESRRDGSHKSKSKVSSKDKTRKPSYPKKGKRRDEESPPPSPPARDFRRDEAAMASLEILSPTGSILHQQEAMHRGKRLDWGFKVNLSAEKVPDPAIYTCEKCDLPILIYGRLIPCKHVFCFNCAKTATDKRCPRCKDPFTRIEQSALGTVYICTVGGGKQTPRGCKRTYLSSRDLNAHIAHRHKQKTGSTGHAPVPSEPHGKPANPSTSHPIPSIPGNIDLSNLSNITDAQLKAAADILAATMNAGKTGNSKSSSGTADQPAPPEALMPQQTQNFPYQQPTPLMSAQPQLPHGAGFNNPANTPAGVAPFPPHSGYHNPAPMNMGVPSMNAGGHSGGYFPHVGGPPPMSGPPPISGPPSASNFGGPPMPRSGGPMMNQPHPYGK